MKHVFKPLSLKPVASARPGSTPCGPGREGSALVVALWVIGLLSLMIGSLAFEAHLETQIVSYYRKRAKAAALAETGMVVAERLMRNSSEYKGKSADSAEAEDDRWFENGKRLADGLAVRGMVEELGEGRIIIDIIPEPARRNVNQLKTEEEWERVLEVGGIPEEWWPELIESVLDWIDKDSVARIDGAETEDYYDTLDSPYRAKNGPLDTVGELLLVKGFTPTILSGGTTNLGSRADEPIVISGIEDLLTTYGDGKVNVNAAGPRVLMTLPEVDELVAGAVIEEREGWLDEAGENEDTSFKSIADLTGRIPDLDPAVKKYITTDSKIYRVHSVGDVSGVRREVWSIVEFSGRKLRVLRWWEEG